MLIEKPGIKTTCPVATDFKIKKILFSFFLSFEGKCLEELLTYFKYCNLQRIIWMHTMKQVDGYLGRGHARHCGLIEILE